MKQLSTPLTHREITLGWACLLLQLFCLPTLLSLINRLLPNPLSEALLNLTYFIISFICVLGVFHKCLWKSLQAAVKQPWRTFRSAFLGFALYQVSNYLLSLGIHAWMPDFSNVNDNAIFSMSRDYFGAVAVGLILLVPITEETLYRGLVFQSLYVKRPIAAYLLSALLFASIHVMGYIGQFPPLQLLLCLLQYLPAGFCLAWAYVKAGTICAPILIHIAINQIGVTAMR